MRSFFQGIVAFAAITGTCLAGLLQFSWWAAVVGGTVLALISVANHAAAYAAVGGGGVSTQRLIMLSTIINAIVTSSIAMFVGRFLSTVLLGY